MPRSEQRHLLSITQAAEYAGVSTKTVRRMISRGDITGYRMGKKLIRVDRADLDAAMRPIPAATAGGRRAS